MRNTRVEDGVGCYILATEVRGWRRGRMVVARVDELASAKEGEGNEAGQGGASVNVGHDE